MTIAVICCIMQLAGVAQSGTTQYIYDANGRLSAVVLPSGAAAVYHYDVAGNLTSIEQITAGSFSVISVSPQVGTVGDQVTLTGVGLDTTTSLVFNGTPAQIVSASSSTLVTAVPAGASTGLITLSGARGSIASPSPFAVVRKIDITISIFLTTANGEGLAIEPLAPDNVISPVEAPAGTAVTNVLEDALTIWAGVPLKTRDVVVSKPTPVNVTWSPTVPTCGETEITEKLPAVIC